jgi:hypothetical protein
MWIDYQAERGTINKNRKEVRMEKSRTLDKGLSLSPRSTKLKPPRWMTSEDEGEEKLIAADQNNGEMTAAGDR